MTVTIDDISQYTSYVAVLIRGSGFTAAQASAMRTDMDTFLATPVPAALDDLDDVDTTTTAPVSGDALVYDGTEWAPGSVSGAIALVQEWNTTTGTSTEDFADVDTLRFQKGLVLVASADPNTVYVEPVTGTTANTLAAGNHAHTTPSNTRATFTPTGYLSSGSRSLTSSNVTLAAGVTYTVEAVLTGQMRGADPDAAYYRLSVTINGNTRQSPAGSDGYWCVQGVPDKYQWDHYQTITGTGASIAVSASVAYDSGAGFNVDAGNLLIRLRPNK